MMFTNQIQATFGGGLKCHNSQISTDAAAAQTEFQSVFGVIHNVTQNNFETGVMELTSANHFTDQWSAG